MKQGKLLIVDDKKTILQALTMFLQFEFEKVQTISNPNLLSAELETGNYDIVLLDMNFKAGQSTGNEGLFWLREIKKRFPETEVVMFTAFGDIALAVNALKEGAADFVLKPWENEKLIATLKSAYRLRKSNREITELKGKEQSLKRELNRGILGLAQSQLGKRLAFLLDFVQLLRHAPELAAFIREFPAGVSPLAPHGAMRE